MSVPILATGFVSDSPGQGSIFPSAGGNSADPMVQAVYWRCIVVLFASARITNPDVHLVLFSNVRPPTMDGIAKLLDSFGVESRLVPLHARLPRSKTPSWGNVLYFLDIFASLEGEQDARKIALIDSDVLVMKKLETLYARIEAHAFVGHLMATGAEEDVNGMTLRQMAQAAGEIDGRDHGAEIAHYGGELFGTRMGEWRARQALFAGLFDAAMSDRGACGKATTEEHFWSIAFATMPPEAIGSAAGVLKRMWTSPRFNNVVPGDEQLPLWHLPAEKRYGLADLFTDVRKGRIDVSTSPDELRAVAQSRCGIPHKTLFKINRDGVRQIAAKIRLRK